MLENKNLPGLSRRAFLGASVTALFAGIAVTITGCGTESDEGDASGGSEGVISSNHSHRAIITKAQLGAGATVTLNIQGGSSHVHTVVISDSQIAAINLGNQVTVTSSATDDHSHTVTFN
jgi:hypothetical protein